MSISNGQDADATNFNAAFASKTADNTLTGIQTLSKSGAANGSSVTNLQRELSALRSVLGLAVDQVYNYILAWATNNIGSSSSTVKDKIDLFDAEYADTGRNAVRSGNTSISSAASTVAVTFSSAWADTNYIVNFSIVNLTDSPMLMLTGVVTTKLTTGFTVTLSGETDTANYVLSYQVRKAV